MTPNKPKIRICYLIDTISCDTAGTQKQLLEIIHQLDRKQFSPYLICLWESSWMKNNNLPCDHFVIEYRGFIKPNFPSVLNRLINLIQRYEFDIVQTFFEDSIFVAFFSSIFSRHKPILLSSRRDIGLDSKSAPWYHKLFSLALPLVNLFYTGIITNSEQVKKYTADKEIVPKRKIQVLYNGVHIPEHISKKPNIFESDPSDIWITLVGSLTPIKRHDLLIKACSVLIIDKQLLNFKVLFLGEGSKLTELKELANELNISKHIYFLGAVKNVLDYLHWVDIGVNCSDKEGLSNSILEYMACGLPVVATSVGGNIELVNDSNGILVPPNDPKAISKALEFLITNPDVRTNYGKSSFARVKKYFLWDKSMYSLGNYYKSLINN